MSEITRLLTPENGSTPDLDSVFERLYPELKRLARSNLAALNPGETLTPTVLVNEAYVRLVHANTLDLKNKRHFFACAARAMRYIVVDSVRARLSGKRAGRLDAITLHEDHVALAETPQQLLDLDHALNELDVMSARQCELVELRFFAGLSVRDIARLMDIPERSMWREWERAKAFLHARLSRA